MKKSKFSHLGNLIVLSGGVTWITWGRRKEEAVGKFPNGGWARLDSIKMGKWKP